MKLGTQEETMFKLVLIALVALLTVVGCGANSESTDTSVVTSTVMPVSTIADAGSDATVNNQPIEAGPVDSGDAVVDASEMVLDSGVEDSGQIQPEDAGRDAGISDAGRDAGISDAGITDSGTVDSSVVDQPVTCLAVSPVFSFMEKTDCSEAAPPCASILRDTNGFDCFLIPLTVDTQCIIQQTGNRGTCRVLDPVTTTYCCAN